MPGHRISPLAIEAQQTGQPAFRRVMTIGAVRHRLNSSLIHKSQDRALLIRRKQCRIHYAIGIPQLSQYQVFMLKDRTLQRALNLGCQTVFLIEALNISLPKK